MNTHGDAPYKIGMDMQVLDEPDISKLLQWRVPGQAAVFLANITARALEVPLDTGSMFVKGGGAGQPQEDYTQERTTTCQETPSDG